MNKIRISALSTLLVLGQLAANATVLYNNIGSGYATGFDFTPTDATTWGAQKFNSGTADTLTSVTLNLFKGGTVSGNFFVSLYTRSGNSPFNPVGPGVSIATGQSISSLGSVNSSTWVSSALNIGITPGQDYFIVVGQASGGSGLNWGASSAAIPGSPFYATFDSGVNWFDFSDANPQRMRVDGVTAVPEPTGYMAASLLAFFGLGHFGRNYLSRKTNAEA